MPDEGYVIKGVLTGLTPSEKWYLATHPHHILTIKENADKALAEAASRYRGAGLHNGNGDAFRHCYWSALLARDIGADNALAFTTAHENYSGNPAGERAMDLHNNSAGIKVAADNPNSSDTTLSNLCAKALSSGKLMTVPPTKGKAYPY